MRSLSFTAEISGFRCFGFRPERRKANRPQNRRIRRRFGRIVGTLYTIERVFASVGWEMRTDVSDIQIARVHVGVHVDSETAAQLYMILEEFFTPARQPEFATPLKATIVSNRFGLSADFVIQTGGAKRFVRVRRNPTFLPFRREPFKRRQRLLHLFQHSRGVRPRRKLSFRSIAENQRRIQKTPLFEHIAARLKRIFFSFPEVRLEYGEHIERMEVDEFAGPSIDDAVGAKPFDDDGDRRRIPRRTRRKSDERCFKAHCRPKRRKRCLETGYMHFKKAWLRNVVYPKRSRSDTEKDPDCVPFFGASALFPIPIPPEIVSCQSHTKPL